MKKTIISFCCFLILLLIFSCSSGKYTISESGDVAEIVKTDGYSFDCELIAIEDTAIIFSITNKNKLTITNLYYESLANIKSIKIKGYSGSGWITSIIAFQAVPAALLTGAAISADPDNGGAVLVFVIPIISALLFAGSDEDSPGWTNVQPLENIKDLNKYCHYPLGINESLLSQLLTRYNQTGLMRIIKK